MKVQDTIICLMGPTASGKTRLAIELVQHFPCEIISVDSAMVYRGMDIGTAKPSAEELAKAPHRLINLCDPVEPYSAGHFREDALQAIKDIHSQGKIPLLVGGTMLYFHVLLQGVASLPTADEKIRADLTEEVERVGRSGMYKKLESIDPDLAKQLHPNDSQRIQRALEVYRITGETMSELRSSQNVEKLPYRVVNLTIFPKDRALLHRRIEQRFRCMMIDGLMDEVKALHSRFDLNSELPSVRTVGYRQVWKHLAREYDYFTMLERGIIATRQLAKRQLTWLRSWPNINAFYTEDDDLSYQAVQYLKK